MVEWQNTGIEYGKSGDELEEKHLQPEF